MVNIVTVDDTNTVQLQYDDKWFHGNWTDTSTQPPSNRSLLSSNIVTAQMVMVFPVVGTGFSYYGMKRSGGGLFRICIDCDPNQPAGPFDTIDALNATDDGHNPPVLLYSKQGLKNDIHMVVLMNTNDTRVHPEGASQITVDKFEVITEDPPVSTVIDRFGGTATVSLNPTATQSSPKGTSTSPGLIAGVVIGVAVLLSIIAVLFLCLRRKRRAAVHANIEEGQTYRDTFTPDPLIISRSQYGHHHNPSGSTLPLMSSSSNILATLNAKGPATDIPTRGSKLTRSPSPARPSSRASVSASSPQVVPSNTSRSRTNLRVETDAGPVDEQEETLPPDYAQVFSSRPATVPPASSSSRSVSNRTAETQQKR